jgi:glycosyltransferase involved in cell wall biosynthesis
MISVVIPTLDSAARIRRALQAMVAAGACTEFDWELIVVDNNSTDGTADVVTSFASEHPELPLKMVLEAKAGISAARNQGVASARYPIIAITDDDCIVTPSWLNDIREAFEREPACQLVCGRVELQDHRDARISIRDFIDHCDITTLGAIRERMMGCNVSIARDVFDAVGGFDTSFGPPNFIQSADDYELFYRALRAGFRLEYVPSIRVFHAHGRRTHAEVAAIRRRYIRGYGGLLGRYIRRGDGRLLKPAYWEMRNLSSGWLSRRRGNVGSTAGGGRLLWNFAAGLAIGIIRP